MKRLLTLLVFGVFLTGNLYAYDKSESLSAFCYQNGYKDEIDHLDNDGRIVKIQNPVSMEEYKELILKRFYESSVITYEKLKASSLASKQKEEEVRDAKVSDDIVLDVKAV